MSPPRRRAFSVDTSAPSLAITGGPTGRDQRRSPRPSPSRPRAGHRHLLDRHRDRRASVPARAPPSHQPAADLADGSYTFRVRATDGAGNSATQTRAFSVDTTAPLADDHRRAHGHHQRSPSELRLRRGGRFDRRVLDRHRDPRLRSLLGRLTTRRLADLADGSYTFRVRATDAAGNATTKTAPSRSVVDTTPPILSITGGPTGTTGDHRPTFTFTAEAGATLECSIDTGTASFGPCSGASQPPAGGRPRRRLVHVPRPGDRRGRQPADPDAELHRRLRGPVARDHRRAHGGTTNDARPTFTFTAAGGATVDVLDRYGHRELRLPARAPPATSRPPTSPTAPTPSASAPRTGPAMRRPRRGASPSTPRRRRWRSPAARPGRPATPVRRSPSTPAPARLWSARSTPACASFGPCSGASSHAPGSDLADGSYTFRVRATDAAGNSATQTRELQCRHRGAGAVDHRRPGRHHRRRPPDLRLQRRGRRDRPVLDRHRDRGLRPLLGRLQPPAGSADLADGSYTFRVRATDAAGNAATQRAPSRSSSTPRRRPSRSPAAPRPAPPATPARPSTSAPRPARPSSARSTPAPPSFGPCSGACQPSRRPPTSPTAPTPSGSGRPTRPATRLPRPESFTVDSAAPSLAITGGPSGDTNDAAPTFTFTAGAGATVSCSIDLGTADFGPLLGRHQPPAGGRPRRRLLHVPRPGDRRGRQLGDPDPDLHRRHPRARRWRSPAARRAPPVMSVPSFDFDAEAGSTVECSIDTGSASFGALLGHLQPPAGLGPRQRQLRLPRPRHRRGRQRRHPDAELQRRHIRALARDHRRSHRRHQRPAPHASPSWPLPARTVACSIDTGSASFGPCSGASSHQPAADLADGSYTFRVRATDGAGNSATQTRAFTVDTVGAGAVDHRRPDRRRPNDAAPSFDFTAEAGAGLRVLDRHRDRELRLLLQRRQPPADRRPRRRRLHLPRAGHRRGRQLDHADAQLQHRHHRALAGDHRRARREPTSDARPDFTFTAGAGATLAVLDRHRQRQLRPLLGRRQPPAGRRPRRRLLHLPGPSDRRGGQLGDADAVVRGRDAGPARHRPIRRSIRPPRT